MKQKFVKIDKTARTSKQAKDVLDDILVDLGDRFKNNPAMVLLAWPELIGDKLAFMTQAISFEKGVLFVKVKNSTLYSLLVNHEKAKLLEKLKKMFTKLNIRDIIFQIG